MNGKRSELERPNFSGGDIVITKLGSPLGKACLVPYSLNWGIIVADVVRVRLNENLVLKEYLVRAINSEIGARQFEPLTKGTTRPRVNLGNIRNLIVPIPPLETQRRLVAILEKAEETRWLRGQADVLANSLVDSIFISMFGDQKRNPRGWEIESLEDIVDQNRQITYGIVQAGPYIENGIPYIKSGDIRDGKILKDQLSRTSQEIAANYERSEVHTGDLVFSIRASVGTVAEVTGELDGANLTQGTARIAPGSKVDRYYLLWALRSLAVQSWIKRQTKGITFKEITLGRLRKTPIMLPPISIQRQFAQIAKTAEAMKSNQSQSLYELDEIFNSIIQKAFSGELVS